MAGLSVYGLKISCGHYKVTANSGELCFAYFEGDTPQSG